MKFFIAFFWMNLIEILTWSNYLHKYLCKDGIIEEGKKRWSSTVGRLHHLHHVELRGVAIFSRTYITWQLYGFTRHFGPVLPTPLNLISRLSQLWLVNSAGQQMQLVRSNVTINRLNPLQRSEELLFTREFRVIIYIRNMIRYW